MVRFALLSGWHVHTGWFAGELLKSGLGQFAVVWDEDEKRGREYARQFGAALSEKTGLPVEFQDERGTTITAHNYLNATNTRGKKRKAVVDAVAAVVILQNYLDRAGQCPEPIRGKTDSE